VGFTLIEMLVVVLIMGILLAVAIPLYLSSVKNAAENTAKANLKTIATAAQAFRVKTGAYPTVITDLTTGATADLSPIIQTGVTYTYAGSVATATETADVFGGTGTTDVITFSLATGAFTGP